MLGYIHSSYALRLSAHSSILHNRSALSLYNRENTSTPELMPLGLMPSTFRLQYYCNLVISYILDMRWGMGEGHTTSHASSHNGFSEFCLSGFQGVAGCFLSSPPQFLFLFSALLSCMSDRQNKISHVAGGGATQGGNKKCKASRPEIFSDQCTASINEMPQYNTAHTEQRA